MLKFSCFISNSTILGIQASMNFGNSASSSKRAKAKRKEKKQVRSDWKLKINKKESSLSYLLLIRLIDLESLDKNSQQQMGHQAKKLLVEILEQSHLNLLLRNSLRLEI